MVCFFDGMELFLYCLSSSIYVHAISIKIIFEQLHNRIIAESTLRKQINQKKQNEDPIKTGFFAIAYTYVSKIMPPNI